MPLSSATLPVTLIVRLLDVLLSNGILTVILGAAVSMLSATEVVAELPARSHAVRSKIYVVSLPSTLISAGQRSIPDSASSHAKCTLTDPRYQPPALAVGVVLAMMLGGVLSTLSEVVVVATLPAISSARAVMA